MLMGQPATHSACGILVLILQLTLTALFIRWMPKQNDQHSLLLVLVFISYTNVCAVAGRVDIPGQVICVVVLPTAKHHIKYKESEVYLSYG